MCVGEPPTRVSKGLPKLVTGIPVRLSTCTVKEYRGVDVLVAPVPHYRMLGDSGGEVWMVRGSSDTLPSRAWVDDLFGVRDPRYNRGAPLVRAGSGFEPTLGLLWIPRDPSEKGRSGGPLRGEVPYLSCLL